MSETVVLNSQRQENVSKDQELWQKAHDEAVEQGLDMYEDPKTGYSVFTSLALKKRGYCCGNKCRHCPYNYENVGKSKQEMQGIVRQYRNSADAW